MASPLRLAPLWVVMVVASGQIQLQFPVELPCLGIKQAAGGA